MYFSVHFVVRATYQGNNIMIFEIWNYNANMSNQVNYTCFNI
jgi:hypothetical protein